MYRHNVDRQNRFPGFWAFVEVGLGIVLVVLGTYLAWSIAWDLGRLWAHVSV